MKSTYIQSNFDKLKLHVMWMVPEGSPKGIVQICHGMSEHKERYIPFMEFLCHAGYAVCIHDHRGHGHSIRKKDDLGYFYDRRGEAIVEDAHQVSLWIKRQFPGCKLHLFGHSMGSLVVRCYLKQYDRDIDSLMVCGSPSRNRAAGFGIVLACLACMIQGDHREGKFFQKLAVDSMKKKRPTELSIHSWISFNEKNVQDYDRDPLSGFIFKNNGFLNLFCLMYQTYSNRGWHVTRPKLPILFLAGQEDPCIISSRAFREAQLFLKKQGYCFVQGILFPERKHEILNERHPEEVYQVILKFLEGKTYDKKK